MYRKVYNTAEGEVKYYAIAFMQRCLHIYLSAGMDGRRRKFHQNIFMRVVSIEMVPYQI